VAAEPADQAIDTGRTINKGDAMKKMVLAALAACVLAPPAMSQTKRVPAGRTAIDLTSESLQVGFSGYDCSAIVKRLKTLNIAKDEFESSQEYFARTASLLQTPLFGDIAGVDPMVLVAEGESLGARYDADTELLSVTLYLQPNVLNADKEQGLVAGQVIAELGTKSRSFIGTNGYGAKAKVTESTTTVCAVGFKNLGYGLAPYRFQVKMAGDKARVIKDRLRVAFVGALTPPYLGTYISSYEATLKDPTSLRIHGDAVLIRLDEAWLFDKATGEVFEKVARPSKF
jgi:hypothetical protein